MLNNKLIDLIIQEAIQNSMFNIIKDYKRITDVPNGQISKMPPEEKRKNRFKELKNCQLLNADNRFEQMASEACTTKGLMFNKGAVLKRIFNTNKMNYTIPVMDFIRFVKNNYPNKKINKKLIPRKKEKNQLDDVEYYNLIINLI